MKSDCIPIAIFGCVLLLFFCAPVFGQESLDELTVEALFQRQMLEEGSFFDDNYQRYVEKQLEKSTDGPLFGSSLWLFMGGDTADPTCNLDVLLRNIGPQYLKLNLEFSGIYRQIAGVLVPHGIVTWVDESYYQNDFIGYDMEVSLEFFRLITLGFAESKHTEFYKEDVGLLPYGDLLGAMDYQRYTLNIGNLDTIYIKRGTYDGLKESFKRFISKFALKNTVVVKEYSEPRLVTNTLYTGISFLPLVTSLYLTEQELFLLDSSLFIPAGYMTFFLDFGLAPLDLELYRARFRIDCMGLIYKALGGSDSEMAEMYREMQESFFINPREGVHLMACVGPEVSFADYSVCGMDVFPYDNSVYFFDQGLFFGFSGSCFVIKDDLVLEFSMRTLIFGSRNFPYPGEFSDSFPGSSMGFKLYFR